MGREMAKGSGNGEEGQLQKKKKKNEQIVRGALKDL